MKISHVLATVVRVGLFTWAFAARAGTTTFQGVSVDYGTANANWVNGDLVLTYTSTSAEER